MEVVLHTKKLEDLLLALLLELVLLTLLCNPLPESLILRVVLRNFL